MKDFRLFLIAMLLVLCSLVPVCVHFILNVEIGSVLDFICPIFSLGFVTLGGILGIFAVGKGEE